jgi:hypothetical protein
MKTFTKAVLIGGLLAGGLAAGTQPATAAGDERGGDRRPGPPQQVIDACKGKAVGDAVQFQSPRGDTVNAVCQLIAVPAGPPRHGGQQQDMKRGPKD